MSIPSLPFSPDEGIIVVKTRWKDVCDLIVPLYNYEEEYQPNLVTIISHVADSDRRDNDK